MAGGCNGIEGGRRRYPPEMAHTSQLHMRAAVAGMCSGFTQCLAHAGTHPLGCLETVQDAFAELETGAANDVKPTATARASGDHR